jgi:hypothetical protein
MLFAFLYVTLRLSALNLLSEEEEEEEEEEKKIFCTCPLLSSFSFLEFRNTITSIYCFYS